MRRDAALVLGEIGDSRAVEPLIRAFASVQDFENSEKFDRSSEYRYKAYEYKDGRLTMAGEVDYAIGDILCALGKIGDKRAIPLIIDAFENFCIWDELIDVLHMLDDPIGKTTKQHNYFDDQIIPLMFLEDPRVAEILIKTIDIEYQECDLDVARALGTLGDIRAILPLINVLCSDQDAERRWAAEALEKLGEPKWLACVGSESVEIDLARLAKTRDERLVEPLVQKLAYTYERAAMIKALGKIGDPRAIEPLQAVLDDDEDLCVYARPVIKKIEEVQKARQADGQ